MRPNDDENYPPLISPRSPSYERAWHEFLHPSKFGDAATVAVLARLSEAEQNAQALCLRVLPALGHGPLTPVVQDHAELHEARRRALAHLIEQLGGSAPTNAECRGLLTRAAHAADAATTPAAAKQVLQVMREELAQEYRAALESDHLQAEQRAALKGLMPAESEP